MDLVFCQIYSFPPQLGLSVISIHLLLKNAGRLYFNNTSYLGMVLGLTILLKQRTYSQQILSSWGSIYIQLRDGGFSSSIRPHRWCKVFVSHAPGCWDCWDCERKNWRDDARPRAHNVCDGMIRSLIIDGVVSIALNAFAAMTQPMTLIIARVCVCGCAPRPLFADWNWNRWASREGQQSEVVEDDAFVGVL